MSTDADNFWESFADKLRKFKGLNPLTPAEAAAALRAAESRSRPASEAEIDSIVDAVLRGEIPVAEPGPVLDPDPPAFDCEEIAEEALALYRNQRDDASVPDSVEEAFVQELLNDDESKEDGDGVAG